MPFRRFLTLCALAAAFIVVSSLGLPALVGSHFVAGGAANAYMGREGYVAIMLGVGIGVPALIALLAQVAPQLPRFVQQPDRASAERLGYLAEQGRVFAAILVVFIAFVHGLVVAGNRVSPAHLPEPAMLAGLAVFGLAELVWAVRLVAGLRARR